MISAEVMDPTRGRATKATIAFTVSYDSLSAVTAARVANELTTLYLSENIETRKQLAAGTAGFLRDEAERLGKSVAEIEAKVAQFKEKNGERLPEYRQFHLQLAERSYQELRDLDTRVRSIDSQLVYLDAQLAQTSPSAIVYTEDGQRVMTPADRIKVLRSQYASALALYHADHPDVKRYKREIEGLESQLGGHAAGDLNEMARRLTDARGQLSAAKERYGATHPDVQRLQREVAGLEDTLRTLGEQPVVARNRGAGADNPVYIQLQAQRSALMNERVSLLAQTATVRTKVTDIESSQAAAPEVEREYAAILRELENEKAKYAEIRQKHMEAQLVQNLETDRKGERFTLIEPPLQPSSPVSPNRKLIMALGFILAGGIAAGLMLLLEQLDTRIRDRDHLMQLVGVPALAVLPFIQIEEDVTRRSRGRWKLVAAGLALLAVSAVLVHLYVRPLDLFVLGALRRFGF
jgi:succinoglycan biosynthesis transport protein ExoP